MAQGPAHIDSPDVIRRFRERYAAFDNVCRNALMSADADIKEILQWLRYEQRTHWDHQLRKREEEVVRANSEYQQALWSLGTKGKVSCVDQKRALEKAKRRKEEAERKVAAVKKWGLLLDQKLDKMMGPIRALTAVLDQQTPRALARLDQMAESLEEYFRTSSGGGP